MTNLPDNNRSEHRLAIDMPDLPAPQLRILQFVIRRGEVEATELRSELQDIPSGEWDEHIQALQKDGFLVPTKRADEQIVYRVQLQRRTMGSNAMKGIWDALNFEEQESVINPEVRRVRSALADRMLADLDKLPVSTETSENYQAHPEAQSLLKDLLATGKTAMDKRSDTPQNTPYDDDAHSLMDDLVSSAKTSLPRPETSSSTTPSQPRRLSTTDFASIPRNEDTEEILESASPAIPPVQESQSTPPTLPHRNDAVKPTAAAAQDQASGSSDGFVAKVLKKLGLGK